MSRKSTGTASRGDPRWCLATAISFWATTACLRATAALGGLSNAKTSTAKPCLSTGPWTRWAVSGNSLSQQPQHQREQRTEQDTSGQRKIEAEALAVYVD